MTTTPVEILPGYFYVPIPEDAENIELHDKHITYHVGMGTDDYDILRTSIPPGSFTLLFTRDDATEEKWKGIVDFSPASLLYKNYDLSDNIEWVVYDCHTATESGASLLRSHNLPQENFVIIKNNNSYDSNTRINKTT